MIILEKGDGFFIWIDKAEFLLKPEPKAGGKTGLELVQADILAGTDTTGHAKYRKILEHHGILKPGELAEWRAKLSNVVEKELTT